MDRTALTQRLRVVHSGVLTIVFCVVLLTGAEREREREREKKTSFEEIDVKRINVVEPDGIVRLIISDKSHFPGLIVKEKEYPHDRRTAGLPFFNDEGTHKRIYMGRSTDHSAALQLKDGPGRDRMVLRVAAEWDAVFAISR